MTVTNGTRQDYMVCCPEKEAQKGKCEPQKGNLIYYIEISKEAPSFR
jgi:hypothetical protein